MLKEKKFIPLPLGEIKPQGWLKKQLEIQKRGLTGQLFEYWDDIKNSGWIGGTSESWERAPYWLDGYIPLAFLLNDKKMISIAHYWIDEILKRQEKSGWLGPKGDLTYGYLYDPWPNFIICKVFIQYFEATQDERIISSLTKFCHFLNNDLENRILRSWARFRWADMAVSVIWLYKKTSDPNLIKLLNKLKEQGFDWLREMTEMPYREKIVSAEMTLACHVVNCAMGIKTPAVASLFAPEIASSGTEFIIDQLDTYHGQATGAFSGDEHLAGKDPSQGYELCSVVEYMYSLEVSGSITGNRDFFDRLESLAFNALPATISADMLTHQYDQQVNQTRCAITTNNPWTTNGIEANIFGFAPNFACCTANMHQGWPKFANSTVMKLNNDKGLVIAAYAPVKATTTIAGHQVSLDIDTNYPFDGQVKIQVISDVAQAFNLQLRLPKWCDNFSVKCDDNDIQHVVNQGYIEINSIWNNNLIILNMDLKLRSEIRFNQSRSFYYGALMLSTFIPAQWNRIRNASKIPDYELYPLDEWNYAVAVDHQGLPINLEITKTEMGDYIFDPQNQILSFHVDGYQIDSWKESGLKSTPPETFTTVQKLRRIVLVPYGATDLRIGEIPIITQ